MNLHGSQACMSCHYAATKRHLDDPARGALRAICITAAAQPLREPAVAQKYSEAPLRGLFHS